MSNEFKVTQEMADGQQDGLLGNLDIQDFVGERAGQDEPFEEEKKEEKESKEEKKDEEVKASKSEEEEGNKEEEKEEEGEESPEDKEKKEEGKEEDDEEEDDEEKEKSSALEQIYDVVGETEGIDLSEYDNNFEGVGKLTNDIANIRAKDLATQIVKDTMSQHPEIAKLYQHSVVEKKSLETFLLKHHVQDHEKIDLALEDGQKQMLSHYYKTVNNLGDDQISTLVKSAEDSGKLKEQADIAKSQLDQHKLELIKAKEEAEIKLADEQEAEDAKIIEQVKNTIRSGKIGDYKLSTTEAKKFESQILGEADIVSKAYDNLSFDQKLLLDYITLNIDKVDSLLGNRAKKVKNQQLDEAFDDNSKRTSPTKVAKDKSGKSSGGNDELSMSEIANINLSQFAMGQLEE